MLPAVCQITRPAKWKELILFIPLYFVTNLVVLIFLCVCVCLLLYIILCV